MNKKNTTTLRPVLLTSGLSNPSIQFRLAKMLDILNRCPNLSRPIISTTLEHIGTVSSIAKKHRVEDHHIIAEMRSNGSTFSALNAAYLAARQSRNERLLIIPPKAAIGDEATFMRAIANISTDEMMQESVTLWAEPAEPEAGQLSVILDRSLKARGWYSIREIITAENAQAVKDAHATGSAYATTGFATLKASVLMHLAQTNMPAVLREATNGFEAGKQLDAITYPAAPQTLEISPVSLVADLLIWSENIAAYPVDLNLEPRMVPAERRRLESIFGALHSAS